MGGLTLSSSLSLYSQTGKGELVLFLSIFFHSLSRTTWHFHSNDVVFHGLITIIFLSGFTLGQPNLDQIGYGLQFLSWQIFLHLHCCKERLPIHDGLLYSGWSLSTKGLWCLSSFHRQPIVGGVVWKVSIIFCPLSYANQASWHTAKCLFPKLLMKIVLLDSKPQQLDGHCCTCKDYHTLVFVLDTKWQMQMQKSIASRLYSFKSR